MTHDDVARWLDAYVDAWRTYDRDAIRALFTDDTEYRYQPWAEPVRGADAIADDWLANPDEPGTWRAEYHPWVVAGDQAVVRGTTHYDDAKGQRTYHNVFLVRFDADGRCREFTEYYVKER